MTSPNSHLDPFTGKIFGLPCKYNYVDFNTNVSPSDKQGRIHWDTDYYTLNIDTGIGPMLQTGQETYTIVYNNTGSDIPNGKAVRITGVSNGYPSVSLAKADNFDNLSGAIRITTMNIPNNSVGIVTLFGRVQEFNTTGFSPGAVYISPDTAGELTSTRPEFPDYAFVVGGIEAFGETDGVLSVEIFSSVQDTFNNFWNGVFREPFSGTVTSDGATVTYNLEPKNGHPDMTMVFSDGLFLLDTDPAATVTLTPGTDSNPQENFVYIPDSTKVLTSNTSGWPTEQHIKVSSVVLRTAATTQTDKALKVRNWNDEVCDTDNYQGHLSHITERLRQENAKWDTGTEGTVTVDSPTNSNIYFGITSGTVYQLHKQTVPAQQMPTDDIHIVNNFTSPYVTVTNLNTQTSDSTGTSIANRSFSFVFWGIANSSGEQNHLMCNLPSGSYLKNNPSNAVEDPNNYSNYTIPKIFQGTGYLIGRATFVLEANGTSWSLYDYEDLRGRVPNSSAGGGSTGGGVTTFSALTDTPNSYIGNAGKVPTVNVGETALEYTDKAAPGGNDTEVQFNDGGLFGASSDFTYDKATGDLTLGTDGVSGGVVEFNGATFSGILTPKFKLDPTNLTFEFGINTSVSGFGALAMGLNFNFSDWTVESNGVAAVSLGGKSNGDGAISIGASKASANNAIAIGESSEVTGIYGIAIGKAALSGNTGIAIGNNSEALDQDTIALLGIANDAGSVSIGRYTESINDYAITIGAGYTGSYRLINNIEYSVLIGFRSFTDPQQNLLHAENNKGVRIGATSGETVAMTGQDLYVAGHAEITNTLYAKSDIEVDGEINNSEGKRYSFMLSM